MPDRITKRSQDWNQRMNSGYNEHYLKRQHKNLIHYEVYDLF
jgi:hypothetical protein